MTPVVVIEMFWGTSDVDSTIIRLAGDPAVDTQEEAVRIVGEVLRRLSRVAPPDWNVYKLYVDQAGRHLDYGEPL